MAEIAFLSQCVWQHTSTMIGVIGYVVAGPDGADRAGERAGRPRGRDAPPPVPRDPAAVAAAWEARGKLEDYRLLGGPRLTPEEDQRWKERALRRLFGVQRATAEAFGNVPKKSRRRRRRRRGGNAEVLPQAVQDRLPDHVLDDLEAGRSQVVDRDLDPDGDPLVQQIMAAVSRAADITSGKE
jgi:hypothetical protein